MKLRYGFVTNSSSAITFWKHFDITLNRKLKFDYPDDYVYVIKHPSADERCSFGDNNGMDNCFAKKKRKFDVWNTALFELKFDYPTLWDEEYIEVFCVSTLFLEYLEDIGVDIGIKFIPRECKYADDAEAYCGRIDEDDVFCLCVKNEAGEYAAFDGSIDDLIRYMLKRISPVFEKFDRRITAENICGIVKEIKEKNLGAAEINETYGYPFHLWLALKYGAVIKNDGDLSVNMSGLWGYEDYFFDYDPSVNENMYGFSESDFDGKEPLIKEFNETNSGEKMGYKRGPVRVKIKK